MILCHDQPSEHGDQFTAVAVESTDQPAFLREQKKTRFSGKLSFFYFLVSLSVSVGAVMGHMASIYPSLRYP